MVLNTMPGDAEVLYQITNLFWHLRRPERSNWFTGAPELLEFCRNPDLDAAYQARRARFAAETSWFSPEFDYRAILGLSWPFTAVEVKAAYHTLAKATHPDVGGGPARFVEVERAYRAALRRVGYA